MYYLVEINVQEISQSRTTYRVTETKPKEIEFGNKTVFILSSHKNKLNAVEKMIDTCTEDKDFMYIENDNYTYNELCNLVERWKKEYATR